MFKKMKKKVFVSMLMGACLLGTSTVTTHGALGEAIEGTKNTFIAEVQGFVDVAGIIGVCVMGLALFIGQRDFVKSFSPFMIIGYIIVRFAVVIWAMIQGGV